jgi:hypothetical protein
MSVCKIALDHVNVCISQQSQMIFDIFMCFCLCMSTQHVFTRAYMRVTCIQQGKGHFRRTRMYTHAWFVYHQSVCVCMRDTRECDAFKPRAKATINPKHTRHDTQDLFAPAIRRGNHTIFIRTHKHIRPYIHVHTHMHSHAYIHTLNSTTTY